MPWTRLRQVALVTTELDRVVTQLHETFGLEVAHRDPAVAEFGLRNALLPVGNQFIEVLEPQRDGTAAGRQRERMGGDGGYMVICHTDDHPAARKAADQLGIRVAYERHLGGYLLMQLHPADTGGSFLEIDYQPGGEDPWGPWMPAGRDWRRAVRTGVVDGITAVTVTARDPERVARRWSQLLGAGNGPGTDGKSLAVSLENATVHFAAGPVDTLVEVVLSGPGPVPEATIGGVRLSGG